MRLIDRPFLSGLLLGLLACLLVSTAPCPYAQADELNEEEETIEYEVTMAAEEERVAEEHDEEPERSRFREIRRRGEERDERILDGDHFEPRRRGPGHRPDPRGGFDPDVIRQVMEMIRRNHEHAHDERELDSRDRQERERRQRELQERIEHERHQHEMRNRDAQRQREEMHRRVREDRERSEHEHRLHLESRELEVRRQEIEVRRQEMEIKGAELDLETRERELSAGRDQTALEAIELATRYMEPAVAAEFLADALRDVDSSRVEAAVRYNLARMYFQSDQHDKASEQLRALIAP